MTDSLNRKRQIGDSFQQEAEQIMKRCQRGTRNYEEANNLHAACYAIIGKLLAQHDSVQAKPEPEQEPVAITITGKLGNIYSFTGDYSLKKGDKVYITPPQRKPLTDVPEPKPEWANTRSDWIVYYLQKDTIFDAKRIGEMMDFAAASAKAAHGIKE